jgi:DNA (cytosine-5)-methyltransferase 1
MPIVAIDLFCGAGGVTCGLRKSGIRVALGIDNREDCRLTYALNNPPARFFREDIRNISGRMLLSQVPDLCAKDYLLLAACAPCQPFSQHSRNGHNRSQRTVLCCVEELVRELSPDFLFLENVPGIQRVGGFSAFRRLLCTLDALRYTVKFQTVDATDYGVPQTRRRLVLLASLYGAVEWPARTHGNTPALKPYVTVREAISKFPPLKAGESHPTQPNHVAAQLSPHNLGRIRLTRADGGSRSEWPPEIRLECHKVHDGHPDVYGRLRWDAPAPTLTTKCTSLSNGRYGHPEQDRAISVREAAALQGFENDYIFYGTIQQVTRQVGNAVPPLLAEHFAWAFVDRANKLNGTIKNVPWRRLSLRKRAGQPRNRLAVPPSQQIRTQAL